MIYFIWKSIIILIDLLHLKLAPNPVQNVTAINETVSNATNIIVEWEESLDFDLNVGFTQPLRVLTDCFPPCRI